MEVHLLGLVDFAAALQLQERLVYEISGRSDQLGVLLLCEHPPVISIGREGSRTQIQAEQHELEACEIDVQWIGAEVERCCTLPVNWPCMPFYRSIVWAWQSMSIVAAWRSRWPQRAGVCTSLPSVMDVRTGSGAGGDRWALWGPLSRTG